MAKNLTEAVFCALKPFTFYRVKDLCEEISAPDDSVRKSADELALGGGG